MKEFYGLLFLKFKNFFAFILRSNASCNLKVYTADDSFYLDLQFFAAEDEGKTEEPTETKKRKAREDGKVPKSAEIPSALVMLFTFWAISLLGHHILGGVKDLFGFCLNNMNEIEISQGNINAYVIKAIAALFYIIGPLIGVAFIVALLSNVVQVGFLFTLKPIKPDFTRISFTVKKLMEKVFFSKQSMMNFVKSSLKLILISGIAFIIIRGDFTKLLNMMNLGVAQGMNQVTTTAFKIINGICLALIVISIPDYIFQRRQHLESLKMTVPELKEERKQEEGDPHVKQRIMQKSRELAQRNLPAMVKSADVVITNPTHIAIALKYDTDQHMAPVVVAKGADHLAHVIRQIAADSRVQTIENKPMAWALYNDAEVGDSIPEALFEAVAMIFSKLDKFNHQPKVLV